MHDLLVSAIDEKRPIVLMLGQNTWADSQTDDPILVNALDRLGRRSDVSNGWASLLGTVPLPASFYEWLAERFERRVHPPWVSILRELPWSAIYTTALDPTLKSLLTGSGREPEIILTANETPRAIRSRARPPLYYLFGSAGSLDPLACPPVHRGQLNTRRISHALPMIGRMLDTSTSLGLVLVDGFVAGRDWLTIEDLLGAIGQSVPEQVMWFGGRPQMSDYEAAIFDEYVTSRQILVENSRLATVVSELRATNQLGELTHPESQESGLITFRGGTYLETTPEERLRVEAVASIVDDAWTAFLAPLGPDSEYDAFRRFHGGLGGPRLMVEGIRRGFAIERSFERRLLSLVNKALDDHMNVDLPLVVHGQSGTGKSIALSRIVTRVRETKSAAVLYAVGRVPQPPQIIARFCKDAEKSGAKVTLIVCDANCDIDLYHDLLRSLRSLGRRVVILGSQYRIISGDRSTSQFTIEAPTELSSEEHNRLSQLLKHFLSESLPDTTSDNNVLAFLYRVLPLSRARIAAGIGTEARVTEDQLRTRARQVKVPRPRTLMAQKLIEAGLIQDHFQDLFNESQTDALESAGAAGTLIDLVMVAGSLNCHVPFSLLLRAVTHATPDTDIGQLADMFKDLDLFRWKWADEEQSELLVLPRLMLEAELLCRRRLGTSSNEADCLIQLIRSVRGSSIDTRYEQRFLLNLLQQIRDNGPRGRRYSRAYVRIARTLTELRKRFGVVHPSIMVQESVLRRDAVRLDVVDEAEILPLLEEARDAIQAALDGIANGTIPAAWRTRESLHGERASLYGFLAYNRASRQAQPMETWSSYEAARTAIRQAVSVSDNYYPLDIGLWTPADILEHGNLGIEQKAEIEADIYATLYQVDPELLSPSQREKFDVRRMKVGNVLKDHKLSDDAYQNLVDSGSTAGYFLRARTMAPELGHEKITDPRDIGRAQRVVAFLSSHIDDIIYDPRCLSLLLECKWIEMMKERPLGGQRRALPASERETREILEIVRTLNEAAGEAARYVTRYLEAVLSWISGDVPEANRIFRALGQDTAYEDPSRVVRRHRMSNEDGSVRMFTGRVEQQRSESRWVVRVDELGRLVSLLSRDFYRDNIAYGRQVKAFGIAFNYIGPIADPSTPRR
ncbi:MAG: hypothetical protein OXT72_14660 [Gammaproteobacteria bacterium]|nr:hypothetical protein [Gammaproteobacteria bacterium]MDE0249039.1 hypothetical protein [Gammaproteobacteria bacterium]